MTQMKLGTRWIIPAAFTVAVVMIAQQLAGKAIRDAFFLSAFDAEVLPKVMTVASLLSVVSVFGVTRLYRTRAPAVLVPVFFFASGAWFAVEWYFSARLPAAAAVSVYIHTTSFGAVAISGFWSVISERFDPYTAKKVLGRVAGGATLGGVLGGIAAWQSADSLSFSAMLLSLCAANVFCGIALVAISRGANTEVRTNEKGAPPWAVFEETPYLVNLGLLVALLAFGTAGIDYVFKATAAATISDKRDLVSFFALFYLSVGVVTFLLQTVVGQRVVQRAGLARAVASLPGAIIILGGPALLFPELLVLAALRGSAATVESSLYRSGYEQLYAPLDQNKKRAAKTLIDVGADKLGAAFGAALAVFVVGLAPNAATSILLCVGIGCAAAGLALTRRLARGYVGALEESLAAGQAETISLRHEGTTRLNIDIGAGALSTGPGSAAIAAPLRNEPMAPANGHDDELRALSAFAQRDPIGIDWALRHRVAEIPPTWVPGLVGLLDDPAFADAVSGKLTTLAPAHIGLLTDAILNPRQSVVVRRRVIQILGQVATQRCAYALMAALETDPFEIRYRAALALSAVKQINPSIDVSREVIDRAGLRAVSRARTNFFGTGTDAEGQLTNAGLEAGRSVAFCIRLMSVVLPPQPLLRALDALGDENSQRRGTGLEYFENVLPPQAQTEMLPFFSNGPIAKYARRSDDEILREIEAEEPDVGRALDALLDRTRRRHAAAFGA